MNATLQALNGKAAGAKVELAGEGIRLGRHPDCEVKIDVSAASRFHAHIYREGDRIVIKDLDSRNKTYVNGKAIEPNVAVPLSDNDRIKICDMLFVLRKPNAPVEAAAPLAEPGDDSASTVLSSLDAGASPEAFVRVRPEAKLRAVLEITRAVGTQLQVEKLFPLILESLFKVFPQADQGILIQRDDMERLIPKAVKHRRAAEDTPRFSRTIVKQVIEKREAVLSADATTDSRFSLSASLVDMRIRSVMCAPLSIPDVPVFGVLQVDTKSATQKFTAEDLEILLSVAGQAALSLENARMHEEALVQARVQRELGFAREVQRSFLPHQPPRFPGTEFWPFYEAAGMVGGDYYDFVTLPNGKLAVLLGDVSGKGVPAALLMAKAASDAKVALLTQPDQPANAMCQLNTAICDAGLEDKFITLALCLLDPTSDRMQIVNAGHMSPMIRRADGSLEEPAHPDVSGIPIGWDCDSTYRVVETTFGPNDSVVVFSDGISEAMNREGKEYSSARLRETIRKSPAPASEMGAAILEDVRKHVAGFKQHDDMALVVFSRTAVGAPVDLSMTSPQIFPE